MAVFLNHITSLSYLLARYSLRRGNQMRSIGDTSSEESKPSATALLDPRALEMTMFGEHSSRRRSSQSGQGMLEYALIVFLVAVVAILGIVFLVPVIVQGITGALPAL
jgi:Flp pilus assembly pilin Flp